MDTKSLSNLFNYKNVLRDYGLRGVPNSLCLPQPRTNSLKKVSCMMGHFWGIHYQRI